MHAVATSMRRGELDDAARNSGVPRVSDANESNSSAEDVLNPPGQVVSSRRCAAVRG